MDDSLASLLTLGVLALPFAIAAGWAWFAGRDGRRQAMADAAAREARRCRPCASMDRATLIAHVAEFAGGFPHNPAGSRSADDGFRRRLAGGLDTAHLRELCATIGAANVSRSVRLPGEKDGWSVYRIQFADGATYVGMTGRPVLDRIAQHLDGSGSPAVRQHLKSGHDYRFAVLTSGLTEQQARARESVEISALSCPLEQGTAGEARPAEEPGDQPRPSSAHRDDPASNTLAARGAFADWCLHTWFACTVPAAHREAGRAVGRLGRPPPVSGAVAGSGELGHGGRGVHVSFRDRRRGHRAPVPGLAGRTNAQRAACGGHGRRCITRPLPTAPG